MSSDKTANGESLSINVLEDKTITVGEKPMVQRDILAANGRRERERAIHILTDRHSTVGVIHELEDIPIPESLIFNSRKYLYGLNTTKFVSLVDRFGLGEYLDNAKKYNYTFLAPENDAIDENAIPNHSKRDWLSYHLLNGSWTKDTLSDGMMLASQFASEPMGGALQRIPVYVDNEEVLVASKPGKSIRFDNARVITDIGKNGNTSVN